MTHYHVEMQHHTGSQQRVELINHGYGFPTREAAEIAADRARIFHSDATTIQVGEACHCPKGFDPETAASLIEQLHDRVVAIEARQRAAGVHDPGCSAEQRPGFNNLVPGAKLCGCWLSREAEHQS